MYQDKRLKILRQKLRNNSTDAERVLWGLIRRSQVKNIKFIRQYSVGYYILDFYSPKLRLCVELDGSQHLRLENLEYDGQRTKLLNSLNIRVLRFLDNEVLQNKEGVIERLITVINELIPS